MRIVEGPSIPCTWCGQEINIELICLGIKEARISGLSFSIHLPYLGIKISDHSIEKLYGRFIAVESELPLPEVYLWICPPDKKPAKESDCIVFTCCPECEDYFCLSVMNLISSKIQKEG
jgi:hypothetical protein